MNFLLDKIYPTMLKIRIVEEKIISIYQDQEIRCPVHLSIGQEGVAVGVCSQLKKKDLVFSAHRAHAHYLAKGGNLKKMIFEIYGKEKGCVMGKGGSMHLVDLNAGFFPAVPIVGSTIPIGVGVAFANKMKKNSLITSIFLGDGSTEEGVFHESLDFAALKNLSILFVCENNFYSVYSPLNVRQYKKRSILGLAKAHGINGSKSNGNVVEDVIKKTKEGINYIKKYNKPYFLEFETYRYVEHCGPKNDDHLKYRKKKEINKWFNNDPINILEKKLSKYKNFLNYKNKLIKKINLEVNMIFQKAKYENFPSPKYLSKHLYA
jgi:pyruvate dehydrogenase E1 component alpha subunit